MIVAWLMVTLFVGLGLVHVYWAMGGLWGSESAVPRLPRQRSASPDTAPCPAADATRAAFTPSPIMTLVVAAALAMLAALVTLKMGLLGRRVDHWILSSVIVVAAVVMLARAIGDFHLVGFFKTVTASEFARLDSRYFSPLCVALGFGLLYVAAT